jgi:uncharacterized protein (DUF58 family)
VIGVAEAVRGGRTLRELELLVLGKLDGLLQGDHQGLIPGGGSEPADGRRYEPGDDVRRIDWNLTARSDAPYVRTTIADRELETWFVVDASASLDFGTAQCEKRDLALAVTAAFGLLTARDGNRVGALVGGPTGHKIVPPSSGRQHVMALLQRLERRPRAPEGSGSVPLSDLLRRARLATRRRGLMVIVTDLLDNGDWARELRGLVARHDVVVVEIRDPREAELPAVGLLTLVDPETGRRLEVQTSNVRLREKFAAAAAQRRADNDRQVRAAGASHLVLSTDRDWIFDIVRFVAARRTRR